MLSLLPAGLGLELWKDDRLRWKAEDVEQPTAVRPLPKTRAAATARGMADSLKSTAGQLAGQVSLRTWLLVAYLSVLHVAVMVSFTSRASPGLEDCDPRMLTAHAAAASALAGAKALPR